jgi:hypothetical protein
VSAIKQWLSTDAVEWEDFLAELTNQGFDMEDVDKVGFVLLEVNGETAVTCIVNQGGEVRCLKNDSQQLTWEGVTHDFSGLEF